MGKAEHDIKLVICDSGPIIHLDELDSLILLEDFSEVFIPDAVWKEVEHHRPEAIKICKTIAKRISHKKLMSPKLKATVQLFSLHKGEIQALKIVQEYNADLFLTDDTAARLAAGSLKITVHGTLGILLRAIRTGQRTKSEVLSVLNTLPQKSTLHLKASLLRKIIKQVEEL